MIDLAERGRSADLNARWQTAEERTLAAIPETEVDTARRHRRADGVPVYTTIQVPYTFAMLLVGAYLLDFGIPRKNPGAPICRAPWGSRDASPGP
jgi:hypothetical protein